MVCILHTPCMDLQGKEATNHFSAVIFHVNTDIVIQVASCKIWTDYKSNTLLCKHKGLFRTRCGDPYFRSKR